ncbi:MAG: UTP--glucose-1-phosphate uridylyltransferase GalU [Pseudomonadota bacterium]
MAQPVRKAVIPVAGLGTRFLPATKAVPKEMLTVVDKPVIQYAVEEAFEAGIEHVVLVTGRNKHVIEDHFDHQVELEATLEARGKTEPLEALLDDIPQAGRISFTRQQKPLGLGHAVWCARDIVGDEPFAVLLPDMVMTGTPGCLAQMMAVYREKGGNIISVEECHPDLAHKYGIVSMGARSENSFEVTGMVEKPAPGTAPTNFFINGRYILDGKVMEHLAKHETGAGGEIQLTDSMLALMAEQTFHAAPFTGKTYDCGSKIGFLQANLELGLAHGETGAEFADLVRQAAATF